MKHINNPNININGVIIVKMFGTKYKDRKIIFMTSICIKFEIVKSLVICNNQEIVKNINKIKTKYLHT